MSKEQQTDGQSSAVACRANMEAGDLDGLVQLKLPAKWIVFAPFPATESSQPKLESVPEQVETAAGLLRPQSIQPHRCQADLQSFFGARYSLEAFGQAAWVFLEIAADRDGESCVGVAGDHALVVWWNGALLYQSPEKTAEPFPPSIDDHRLPVIARRGNNVLAVRLAGGRSGAVLAIGGPRELALGDYRSICEDPYCCDLDLWGGIECGAAGGREPVAIGGRRELFLDDYLIDALGPELALRLHSPQRREVVMRFGREGMPWEGSVGYPSLLRSGDTIRMYYSGRPAKVADESRAQFTCLMESEDGIEFRRPQLGLHPFRGDAANNIVLAGTPGHNFTPFLDRNPACAADARFKAVAYHPDGGGLGAFVSPDGIHWRQGTPERILLSRPGVIRFDSQNLAFWDERELQYLCYFRDGTGGLRRIFRAVSPDFVHWREEGEIDFGSAPPVHLYTNNIQPYFRAPHLLVGMPARFLTQRKKNPGHPVEGISDAILISSRDGIRFHRWPEAFIRPGTDPGAWNDRCNFAVPGLLRSGNDEISVYWNEHYRTPAPRLVRGVVRLDGFASLHAGGRPGAMLSRPLRFSGAQLELNYATTAAGSIRIGICDEVGNALPGFSCRDSNVLYGNEICHVVHWRGRHSDLSNFAGRLIRLRVEMQEADLFALRFAEAT